MVQPPPGGIPAVPAAFTGRRWLAPAVMAASVAIIFGIGSLLRSELAPMEDKSRLMINVTAPGGNLL